MFWDGSIMQDSPQIAGLRPEQRHCYYGLNGDLWLLARSLTDPFILPENPPVLVRKKLGNIGSHPVNQK